jgi:DUF2946 family protein
MPLYRNRFAALLAILAVALQALWPLVAQAKPVVPGERVPVCTIEGITHYIELPAPDSAVEKSSAAHHEHCKMCVFGAAKLAVIASAEEPLTLGSSVETAEPWLDTVSAPSTFDRPAQPRAPPAAS